MLPGLARKAIHRQWPWTSSGIRCFLTMRLLTTWLTADSVNAVEAP